MSQNTSIEWTESTWNPTRGCSRVSPGCVNCYAERIAARFAQDYPDFDEDGTPLGKCGPFKGFVQITNGHPQWTGKVELIEWKLTEPLHWKKPRMVFVNSMSDLFHEALSDDSIDRVFAVMYESYWNTFQVLTKRAQRMHDYFVERGYWPYGNVWVGVSVEDQKRKDRIDLLRDTPAAIRFLSIEPLLEDIGKLDLRGIDWVIIGGESGPGARPFDLKWARSIIEQCAAAGVACFMKQVGSNPVQPRQNPDATFFCQPLKDPKGGNPAEWPADLRVRQYPKVQSLVGRPQEQAVEDHNSESPTKRS